MATSDASINSNRRPRRFNVVGFLIFFLLVLGVILLAQALPIYLHRRAMEDAAVPIVQRAARQQLDLNDVRAQLHESARQCSLPQNTSVTLSRDGRKVTALISYQDSVSLPGKSWAWPVRIQIEDLGY